MLDDAAKGMAGRQLLKGTSLLLELYKSNLIILLQPQPTPADTTPHHLPAF